MTVGAVFVVTVVLRRSKTFSNVFIKCDWDLNKFLTTGGGGGTSGFCFLGAGGANFSNVS